MSGICGFVGEGDPAIIDAMLAAIDYRGDRSDTASAPGASVGYRFWGGRPGKAPGLHRAGAVLTAVSGTLAPAVPHPAATLSERISTRAALTDLDGAFAAASWDSDARRLTLARDPFGIRSLYFVEHAGTFWFASELKQLCAIPGLPVEIDPIAVHKYLTFSFVPGDDLPVKGVRRVRPGHVATWHEGRFSTEPYFRLTESIDPTFRDPKLAVREARRLWRGAIERRLNGEAEVALYLSGGIDSSSVAAGLRDLGARVRAYSLDFGDKSVEKPQAQAVAAHLGIPLELVRVEASDIAPIFDDLVYKLDLPFGDPVTGPQYLLGRAAAGAGVAAVFNGEGGDQLFGGWTTKPMLAAELYSGLYEDETREETYLRSYHRFYGREDDLYTDAFKADVGGPGKRRAHLRPLLESPDVTTFLGRVRLADISLKGSLNIIPRAERMTNAWGLDARMPLFDRALAEFAFRLPPELKLRGASEKWVLKRALRKHLPPDIVWRRKSGMCVPATDWVTGPLAPLLDDLLGSSALERRGLFRADYVARLRQGQDEPSEMRRRRIGEKLWALAMLEAWMRRFIDARGRPPGAPK